MSGQSSLIAISTPLGEDVLHLRQATLEQRLGGLFCIDADFLSDDEEISLDDILGKNVTIRMETEEDTRFLNGVVTEFYQKDNFAKNACYGATIRPWFWLLTLTANCRIFQEKSYPDIIKAVFSDLGFSDFEDKLTATYEAQDYVVQFNESDFNFVSRIMQQEGIYYYFKHTNGKHTMVLLDDNSTLPDAGNVQFFELEDESVHDGVEGITNWHNHRQVRTGGISLSSYDFEMPTKNLDTVTADPQTSALASLQKYNYPGRYSERTAGEKYTKLLMEKENVNYEQKRLSGNSRKLFCGAQFTLDGYHRDDQNTQYLITEYKCILRGDAYMAQADSGGVPIFEFQACAIPAKVPFRPQMMVEKPKMSGPQTATVVGKSGEEIWTDKYGRIKVYFHWDKQGAADEKSSCWIRVSQTLAGKNWGSIYIPRIGQEVLVDFLNGDPDKPIVIGCVYNNTTMPPYPLPANATMTGYKSRTSKGGGGFNEIRLEDKKDEEQIYIHGQKNLDMLILNDCFETIGNDRHTKIENDQFIEVVNNRNEHVKKDHVEKIGKDRHLNVEGKEAKAVKKDLSLTVDGDVAEIFKKSMSTNVTKDSFTKAENICLEASTNITFKVGKSSIAIEKGGITISSPAEIKIESKAGVKIEGKASVDVKGAQVKIEGTAQAAIKAPMVEVAGSGMTKISGGMVKIN
jgi:type VI secretion system secreted protein VgrG